MKKAAALFLSLSFMPVIALANGQEKPAVQQAVPVLANTADSGANGGNTLQKQQAEEMEKPLVEFQPVQAKQSPEPAVIFSMRASEELFFPVAERWTQVGVVTPGNRDLQDVRHLARQALFFQFKQVERESLVSGKAYCRVEPRMDPTAQSHVLREVELHGKIFSIRAPGDETELRVPADTQLAVTYYDAFDPIAGTARARNLKRTGALRADDERISIVIGFAKSSPVKAVVCHASNYTHQAPTQTQLEALLGGELRF